MRTGLVIVLAVLALVVAARGLERRTTWYLASDQFAFLTFADDLRHGTVFHDATIVRRLSPYGHAPDVPVDALFQTYIYRDGHLYSRYPPGFPLLLAAAGAIGGERAQHLLNPLLYLALLAALGLGVGQLAGAAAGVAVMWALLVVPAEVHYWGITVARDLPAHLLALVAVWAAWRGRTTLAGFVLGYACSIRPDAVLWGLAVGAVAPRLPLRTLVRGGLAFGVGLVPLLAYNTITQGHPFAFTQGSEFRHVLAATPPALLASLVSGGGFRFAHLPATLPVHLRYLWDAFGLLLIPALGALCIAVRRRAPIAGAFGPYAIVAFLFYSCWGHGDARYLVGVALCLLALAAIGTAQGCRWLSTGPWPWRLVAVAVIATILGVVPREHASRVRTVELALGGAALVSLVLPPALAAVAPAAAMATVGLTRVAQGSGERDPFQEPQVDRARAAIEALVPSGSLVLTTPSLGRPGENITHYTHADASYLGETSAMGSSPAIAAQTVLGTGDQVFLLLGTLDPLPFVADIREVARRDGPSLHDWFADPTRAPLGAVLYEVVGMTPPS
ncbi:MAG TPA: hypothetical protein VGR62_13680 [Candidatus Binatia bacterium]|nr:hypothetical protein [Candidatus Binatia bacterium]